MSNEPKKRIPLAKKLSQSQQGQPMERPSIVISSEAQEEETILATDGNGGSLTLMEEYALREQKASKGAFLLGLLCASVSLYFAYLTFQNL